MAETEYKYDIFISYSHKDEEWVRDILLPTLERHGLKICIDYRDFIAGTPAIINMQTASESSRHTLLVLSPRWVESEWTLYESILSRTDDPSGLQRRTIPLLVEKCAPPKFISILSWVDFTDKRRENEAWQSLFKSISEVENTKDAESIEQKQLAKAVTAYKRSITSQIELGDKNFDSKSPYKSLLEYDIRDIPFFFGRESAIKEMLAAINRNPLTVLHAESGAGKTSLLKAGIRPSLFADGHLPLYVRSRQDPVDVSIKRALLHQLQESPIWIQANLHDFTREVSNLLDGKWLIIILDQFEEVFAFQSQEVREQFVRQLAQCLDDDLLPVRWILSLRGEALSKIATFRRYIRNPLENNVLLESLKREEARIAILKPAELKAVHYDNQLVDTILDELGPQEIRPPELQIICSALYEARGTNQTISQELHETLGGTKGILHEHFDRVLNQKIPPDQKPLAQQVLVSLVDDNGARISLSRNDIEDQLKKQKIDTYSLSDVLSELVDSQLLKMEETNAADQSIVTYELAHDYLTDKIELDPTLQGRKIAQKLVEQKIPHYKRNGILLSSDELALIYPHEDYLSLNADASELLAKSKKNEQRLQFRNGVSSISITVLGAGIVFFLTKYLGTATNIVAIFWVFIFLFAILGWVRGWAKELLISFSAILALALIMVMRKYVPFIQDMHQNDVALFWFQTIILLVLVYFGYQTVSISRLTAKATREKAQDALFGGIMGGFNGYLVVGAILYWMNRAEYPFPQLIPAPTDPTIVSTVTRMMSYMPPLVLSEPGIYFAIILWFIFVLVVYY